MNLVSTQPIVRAALLPAPSRSGAEPTTREIFQAHAAFVLRLVRRLGVRPADVEDVAQEVFVIVHRRLPDLQSTVPLRSWLFGITRRVVANYRRQARHRLERTSDTLDLVPIDCDQPALLQGSRDRERLEHALARLSDDKREVFVLFELEGVSMREVAAMVGCPLNTAYSRLHAARVQIRQHVLGGAEPARAGARHAR